MLGGGVSHLVEDFNARSALKGDCSRPVRAILVIVGFLLAVFAISRFKAKFAGQTG